jgi:hypothetical protein
MPGGRDGWIHPFRKLGIAAMIREAMTSVRDEVRTRVDDVPTRRALRTVLATFAVTIAIVVVAVLAVR